MADGSSQGGVVTPKQDKHLALQGDDTYTSTHHKDHPGLGESRSYALPTSSWRKQRSADGKRQRSSADGAGFGKHTGHHAMDHNRQGGPQVGHKSGG